jgi:hypothetical protein
MKAGRLLLGAAASLLAILFLGSCPITPSTEDPGAVPGGDIALLTELFEQSEENPQTRVFFTNDPALQGPYGCTAWMLTGSLQEPFAARELELQKVSGDGAAGFGVVLCRRDDGQLGETMLVVLINTRRKYTVGEVNGAQFHYLVRWTECSALVEGNAFNRLRVASDGEGFSLHFNGFLACSFRDEEEPLHPGGDDGLIVVISPQDRFPETGVHVVFRELEP